MKFRITLTGLSKSGGYREHDAPYTALYTAVSTECLEVNNVSVYGSLLWKFVDHIPQCSTDVVGQCWSVAILSLEGRGKYG